MDKLIGDAKYFISNNVKTTKPKRIYQLISDWLSTFNTDSATECFTAVQQLKEKLNGQMD